MKPILINITVQPGHYLVVLTYDDLIQKVRLREGPDFYLNIVVGDDETLYEGHLREQTMSAVLGQTYLHNVHLARGDLM